MGSTELMPLIFYCLLVESSESSRCTFTTCAVSADAEMLCPPESPTVTDTHSESSAGTTSTAANCSEQLYPKVCRNVDQFKAWQRSRRWLVMNDTTNSVQCSVCTEIKRLGLHNERGQHYEPAFVDGTVVAKDAKSLLKKLISIVTQLCM